MYASCLSLFYTGLRTYRALIVATKNALIESVMFYCGVGYTVDLISQKL